MNTTTARYFFSDFVNYFFHIFPSIRIIEMLLLLFFHRLQQLLSFHYMAMMKVILNYTLYSPKRELPTLLNMLGGSPSSPRGPRDWRETSNLHKYRGCVMNPILCGRTPIDSTLALRLHELLFIKLFITFYTKFW